jgi:hypothetical protein
MSWLITPQLKNKLLLDEYPGAVAAYSLRNLTILSDAPVVRVRRSSDNAEQDFTAIQVTDGTLTTFCGAGNGFVRTWYDQSGSGNHAATTTTTRQPEIVSSGLLILENNKPVIKFDGTSHFLTQTISTTVSQPFTTILALKKNANLSRNQDIFRAPHGGAVTFFNSLDANNYYAFAGTGVKLGNALVGDNILSSVVWNGGSSIASYNGAQAAVSVGTQGLTSSNRLNIATGGSDPLVKQAAISLREFIIYPNSQSVALAAIEANINAHYAIY